METKEIVVEIYKEISKYINHDNDYCGDNDLQVLEKIHEVLLRHQGEIIK